MIDWLTVLISVLISIFLAATTVIAIARLPIKDMGTELIYTANDAAMDKATLAKCEAKAAFSPEQCRELVYRMGDVPAITK